jgi:arabinogalactan oligomer / maltooligosaccharide transport system permease protein
VQAVNWDPFSDTPYVATKTVNFAGGNLLASLFNGAGADIMVFEIMWTVLSVSLQAALGIGLALMLNQRNVRYANFWRTIFILPWAIPEFIGALVWLRTFDPTAGWVGQAFGGSIASKLLSNGGYTTSLVVLLTSATWFGFPFIMLAASASLKLVPQEVYDAAAMDGADGWNLFRHVTWPLLMPLVVPALIIRAIFAFNQFYLFFVMPTRLATFAAISYYFFNFDNQYAVSAAINVFTVVILIALLVLFNRWSKAAEGVTYV